MTAINDITKDKLISKTTTQSYADNYDAIFRTPINLKTYPRHEFELCKQCGEIECKCENK